MTELTTYRPSRLKTCINMFSIFLGSGFGLLRHGAGALYMDVTSCAHAMRLGSLLASALTCVGAAARSLTMMLLTNRSLCMDMCRLGLRNASLTQSTVGSFLTTMQDTPGRPFVKLARRIDHRQLLAHGMRSLNLEAATRFCVFCNLSALAHSGHMFLRSPWPAKINMSRHASHTVAILMSARSMLQCQGTPTRFLWEASVTPACSH